MDEMDGWMECAGECNAFLGNPWEWVWMGEDVRRCNSALGERGEVGMEAK